MTGDATAGTAAAGDGWQWDVALSYAGAQRDYVEQVAAALKRRVRCFYDADEQVRLWGTHLAEELPLIYAQESAVVVVFVSADYTEGDWTRLERRAAFGKAVAAAGVCVLPARFDDSELPELLPDVASVDLRGLTPEQFADLVVAKLAFLHITGVTHDDGGGRRRRTASDPGALRVGDEAARARPLEAAGLAAIPGITSAGILGIAGSAAGTDPTPGEPPGDRTDKPPGAGSRSAAGSAVAPSPGTPGAGEPAAGAAPSSSPKRRYRRRWLWLWGTVAASVLVALGSLAAIAGPEAPPAPAPPRPEDRPTAGAASAEAPNGHVSASPSEGRPTASVTRGTAPTGPASTPEGHPTADVAVPTLIGMRPDRACPTLQAAGLACDPHDGEATRDVNVVHAQNPPAGTMLPAGTPVKYTYESTAPLPLRWFQAPAPYTANLISPTAPPPPRWVTKPVLGSVYSAGERGVPGLVPVYQFHCIGNCGETTAYRLATESGGDSRWALDGEAFRCFDPAHLPAGTRPLHMLRDRDAYVRAWAVPGTREYNNILQSEPGKFEDYGTLCFIW